MRWWPRGLHPDGIFILAAAIAFGMSLQFLAQIFVWRNWTLPEILQGWLYVLRDRLMVAMLMAVAVTLLRVQHVRSARLSSALLAMSILFGAVGGEVVVRLFYGEPLDIPSLITHSLRWGAVALAGAASYLLWRTSVASHARLLRETLQRQHLEQQLTNTRLNALQKQIEPHFLFNTLATVRRLHQIEPETGARMLANFVDYLRGLLPMLARSEVQLGEELDIVRAYLSVIRIRMAERLQVRIDVPAKFWSAQLPTLALATLVENAIKHGLAPSPSGGEIRIQAYERDDLLEVCVADTGVGLKADNQGGSGIGLYNVRARLATLYGPRACVRIQANTPTGVRASLYLPLRSQA
jgi:signal transduction histidine kinase